MSVFNLDIQNSDLDSKIVAGLERLSQVFRILLWEKAKECNLSPIQIQILIFIRYHSQDKSTISYLAKEFNLTKPTISEAVKILEQKNLLKKITDKIDTRSYTVRLTEQGKKIVSGTENFANPVTDIISISNLSDKLVLWEKVSNLIIQLNKLEVINIQRTCFNCRHYAKKSNTHYCNLLEQKLHTKDIRIDCGEFETS